MKIDSMLRRLPPESSSSTADSQSITLHWYEQEITALSNDTVASALLLAGIRVSRESGVSGEARLPFCMMGSCFECLIEINGQVVQSCMTTAKEGMQLKMPEQTS
jgi:predicted molibdopterin-dependent oxidoreductase YjgC